MHWKRWITGADIAFLCPPFPLSYSISQNILGHKCPRILEPKVTAYALIWELDTCLPHFQLNDKWSSWTLLPPVKQSIYQQMRNQWKIYTALSTIVTTAQWSLAPSCKKWVAWLQPFANLCSQGSLTAKSLSACQLRKAPKLCIEFEGFCFKTRASLHCKYKHQRGRHRHN